MKTVQNCARLLASLLMLCALAAPQARAAGVVNPCTEASLNAALSGGGLVTFGCSGTINITSQKQIALGTTINGAGQNVTIAGNGTFRLFKIANLVVPNFIVNISNITFTGGAGVNEFGGGAILVDFGPTLNVSNSAFIGNSASGGDFPIGGAITSRGTLGVTNSTFTGNTAAEDGGAIFNALGTLTVKNSTFVGNSAGTAGGAINSTDIVIIDYSTFSSNSAPSGSAVFQLLGSMTISNSILSSASGGACGKAIDGSITDGGYNLAMDTSCGFSQPTTSQQNVTAQQLALGALSGNGGPTQTIPLLSGSISINAIPFGINGCGTTTLIDQRSVARPQGSACEIGAYELRPATVGDGVSCSFAALQTAVANTSVDLITFNCPASTTITWTNGVAITLNHSVSLDGFGQSVTLSGNNNNLFVVPAGTSLSVLNLTLANGSTSGNGGAILNSGALFVHNSTIRNSTTTTSGGAIFNNVGTAQISNSTFSANSAVNGGAVYSLGGTVNITNSTFSGNSASSGAGAVFAFAGAINITNSTFSGNSAFTGLGGAVRRLNGTLTIRNSILSSTAGGECAGTIADGGYNLAKDASCSFTGTGSQQNVSAPQLALGALASNGGPSQTIAIQAGSIAMNAIPPGANCGAAVALTDQRGIARPQAGACDIGAYEISATVVGNGTPGSCTFAALQAAVLDTNNALVGFNCPNPTTITFTSTIFVNHTVIVDGSGQSITLSGGNTVRIFSVPNLMTATFSNLTFSNGNSSLVGFGGAIRVQLGGTAIITNCTFTNNSAVDLNGGAISVGGTAIVTNSTFVGNTANSGAAIDAETGSLTITNATFAGNTATGFGGVSTIRRSTGTVTVRNSILSGAGPLCDAALTDGGYNRAADTTCGLTNITSAQSVASGQFALGTLGNNGGLTQTVPLLPGSVAINAIPAGPNCGPSIVANDQRGFPRPQSGSCDAGAYEARQSTVGNGSAPSCNFTALQTAIQSNEIITFNCPNPTTITFTSTIGISQPVSVDGSGQGITFSGGNTQRLFNVTGGVASFNSLTFRNGNAANGAAIQIASGVTASIINATFAGNAASAKGGAISNTGTTSLTNVTFSANAAGTGGGAVENISPGTMTITHATFAGNTSTSGASTIQRTSGTINVFRSLLTSSSGAVCSSAITDGGYNLGSDTSCTLTGTGSAQGATPLQLALGGLGSNGGPAQSIPLLAGSIALNAIPAGANCGVAVVPTDQRGTPRPGGGSCDIGAYEAFEFAVGNGSAPSCSFTALQDAINNGFFDLLTFNCPANTTFTWPGGTTFTLARSISLNGAGQSIILSASNSRFFVVPVGLSLGLNNLTLGNTQFSGDGAAIQNAGTLFVNNSTITNNFAVGAFGGAISSTGAVTVGNASFLSNAASTDGGALAILGGTAAIANATFAGNQALTGSGGAILTDSATVSFINSTFSGNQASIGSGGAILINSGTASITNSTFSGNQALAASGGALRRNGGTLSIGNSILSSTTGGECAGIITDGGYNLVKDATCDFTAPGTTSQLNVTAQQLALGALGSNGGPTQTILPGRGSLAIDLIPVGANCGPAVVPTDQRGIARPQHARCDAGSVELPYRVAPRLVSE